ncbi:cyclic-di-AMP-binding protein CbpB [Fredinandcohnia quinoae]|uniref:CBS domain-containing protein n=1 Tax=Fredinandcohnia quinoae TaxID=2918902 RepID=A0AAW5E4B5_9BACI|nr:cyclic-di-AMP-binding protein CbpB [Fredinandcohnia sp. SECRCQ15]MCH1623958.1 CBS domain-containing protein [Fredinandcohnia sp. SECRCQ15]
MISLQSGELFDTTIKDLLIPADKVAHVQLGNNLEHALLVLTKTGYTAVPVLDPHFTLHGLISSTHILDSILGLERIEFERLETMKVEEVMNTNIPRLNLNDQVMTGLNLVIDHPFVCVENDEAVFEGIFTRRAVLKQLDRRIKNK